MLVRSFDGGDVPPEECGECKLLTLSQTEDLIKELGSDWTSAFDGEHVETKST